MTGTLAERFWAKVSKTPGCWLWGGATNMNGYGHIGERGHMRYAHRVSYELAYGSIPAGMYVCHHCDNPPCVRPEHLFLGTHQDNMADMRAKGRDNMPKGEGHWNAVLDWPSVRVIRARYASGETGTAIARSMGVSQPTISRIVLNRAWVV